MIFKIVATGFYAYDIVDTRSSRVICHVIGKTNAEHARTQLEVLLADEITRRETLIKMAHFDGMIQATKECSAKLRARINSTP